MPAFPYSASGFPGLDCGPQTVTIIPGVPNGGTCTVPNVALPPTPDPRPRDFAAGWLRGVTATTIPPYGGVDVLPGLMSSGCFQDDEDLARYLQAAMADFGLGTPAGMADGAAKLACAQPLLAAALSGCDAAGMPGQAWAADCYFQQAEDFYAAFAAQSNADAIRNANYDAAPSSYASYLSNASMAWAAGPFPTVGYHAGRFIGQAHAMLEGSVTPPLVEETGSCGAPPPYLGPLLCHGLGSSCLWGRGAGEIHETSCALPCASSGPATLPAFFSYSQATALPQTWAITITATMPAEVGVHPFLVLVAFDDHDGTECMPSGGSFDVTISEPPSTPSSGQRTSSAPPESASCGGPLVFADLQWSNGGSPTTTLPPIEIVAGESGPQQLAFTDVAGGSRSAPCVTVVSLVVRNGSRRNLDGDEG